MKTKKKTVPSITPSRAAGRAGYTLQNNAIAARWLAGGGHLASFVPQRGSAAGTNLVWEATWPTIDPHTYSRRKHSKRYGPEPAAQYLSGYTGHALCVDYFAAPSPEEAALGLPIHGEVASRKWRIAKKRASNSTAELTMRCDAPAARISVQRDITLLENEPVMYVTETVTNRSSRDRYIQWVQHATFGPPLARAGESLCVVPGTKAMTSPGGYDGKPALKPGEEFTWPQAPAANGGTVDISQPFSRPGEGFVIATLLADDRASPFGYTAVLNWRMGLVAGYLFRRAEYPWIINWEENVARADAPWNGKTQARGIEFGNTPEVRGLQYAVESGALFGAPAVGRLAARAKMAISYGMFAAEVPKTWRTISGIVARNGVIEISGQNPGERIELPAANLEKLWPHDAE